MNKTGSVFSMGSGGATYEYHVQAAYLLAMMLRIEVPLVTKGKICEVAFQTTNRGYATDDLMVIVDFGSGNEQKILGQIKHNIVLTKNNDVFNEVITAFWKDFNNASFNKSKDRLLLVKSNLTNNDKKHIVVLLDWASTHKDENDFYKEVERIEVKKKHLDIFENLLKRANDGKSVSKKNIWLFLKSMALAGYDFGDETSTALNNSLNLITISKGSECGLNGLEIWNSLLALAANYNQNGGAITYDDSKQLDVYSYFNPSVFDSTYPSISKLLEYSSIIIEPFTSYIEDFHLDRSEKLEELSDVSLNHQFTIVSGDAGAGKSALLKDYIENFYDNVQVFVFKAEQFNETALPHVFTKLGVNDSITDIISSIGYLKEKLIVIDSLEKLLEANLENAFQQFLAQIRDHKDVKVILTSRANAVNLILQKYHIPKAGILEIELLSDAEMHLTKKHFPSLEAYFDNPGLKEILRSPKYLEFAVRTIGVKGFKVENLSIVEFKSKLWSHIIEKSTITGIGMARKRGKAFSNIALKRAKLMRLFVEPDDGIDEGAVEALLDDHVLFKSKNDYQFSPSHDILEDWGLVKYILKLRSDVTSVDEFFSRIGGQPALRRAFRLWVEDYLIEDPESIVAIIRDTINNEQIERYWVDEILVAVFRSKDASVFFQKFKADLLAEDAVFLNRCILLARTACKEYGKDSESNKSILFPNGDVWKELLVFIAENLSAIPNLRESIFLLLMDWELRFILDSSNLSEKEIDACKRIVLQLIEQIEAGDDFWLNKLYRDKYTIQHLVYLLFGLVPYAKSEVEAFLERGNAKKDTLWHIQQFYDIAIKIALDGIRNQNLVKELPELLIKLTETTWKEQPRKEVKEVNIEGHRRISSFLPEPRPKKDESWGITDSKFEYYPSGIYKTFITTLFVTKPVEAIAFVVDFVNYSVDYLMSSKYGKENPLEQITLRFEDGGEKVIYGDLDLWVAYRGLSTQVNPLIESILMSMERYLLLLAGIEEEIAKRLLEEHCKYILQLSNNVAPISVIASVFMAHPKAFTKNILPIFGLRQFYEWDLQRAISEHQSMAPQDRQIAHAQKERMESNALSHRRKYYQGLRAFMIPYQFNVGEFNEGLFEIFDRFYNDYKDDHLWIKTVTEMDVRKLETGKVDKETGTIELRPSYPKEIAGTLKAIEDDSKDNHLDAGQSNLLLKTLEKKEEVTFKQWQEIYNNYSAPDFQNGMFDMPATFAKVGLDSFAGELNPKQISWCFSVLYNAVDALVKDKYNQDYSLSMNYSVLEKEPILHSIHLLGKYASSAEDSMDYKLLLGKLVLCPLDDYYLRQFLIYFRKEFSENCPDMATDLRKMVINFAKFEKENPRPYRPTKEEELEYEKGFEEFITACLELPNKIDFNSIDYNSHEKHFLIRVMLMIPTENCTPVQADYVVKVLNEFVVLHQTVEGDTWRNTKQHFDYTSQVDMQLFLGELWLYADSIEYGKRTIDILMSPFLKEKVRNSDDIHDLYEFISGAINFCVTIMYDIVRDRTNTELQKYGSRFWQLWDYMFHKINGNGKYYFSDKLLLNNRFLKNLEDWEGFLSYKTQYLNMAKYFGAKNLSAILAVFSTFGEKEFLPEGILLLEKLSEDNPDRAVDFMGKDGKALIKKLFFNHVNTIKNRQDLVNAFLHILGLMIDSGSTEAYLIRENVFIYKTEV
ncbi:NACHT domain-containing protein [Salegentibacter flavus]|uniref:AAA+ ATPase domain-containing protein n=1 Tax=Salegentibacter flavus TaxID=287099 RepID=A0A1I4YJ40_9FLAO|nr:ATP-binding protein [Salegentibacter flavus]SFN37833.1 hypothetical protein SAMN05660413_00760 [Salegentibacter flavus]